MADEDLSIHYRTFKFSLLPNQKQHQDLAAICESQRQLYNAALQERMDCYQKTKKGRTYIDQCKAITELRRDAEFAALPVNLQRWTLKRLDDAYKGFFGRIKRGETAGFPRFRGRNWFRSFGFNEFSGIRFDGRRLRFKGLRGGLRVHMHRPLPGGAAIKSCVIRRDTKGWHICFQCAVPASAAGHAGAEIGIDVGLKAFATLSSGDAIPNPRIARRHERELRRRQRALARCKRGSNRRRKVRQQVARLHDKIANIRNTFLHQQSARLARDYRLIAVEDLRIRNMVRSHLAKSIHDAAWGTFIDYLTYKAESAGGRVIRVDPRRSSQECSGCGEIVKKELKERTHRCPHCGLVMDRDENAAAVILSRGVMAPYPANVTGCRERLGETIGAHIELF